MAVSASEVKSLRDKTGAGMMDCKKALIEAEGNFEKAIEILRKKGASVAAKRAERSANEGVVKTELLEDGKAAVMVEVNCETDFVANSDDFQNFASIALKTIVEEKPENKEALMEKTHDGRKVGDLLTDLMGKIGEKIEISRFVYEQAVEGIVVDYVHHGSKLGVLVRADNVPAEHKDEYVAVLKDVAMQIAAMNPTYAYRTEVPSEIVEKEKDIYKEVSRKEGKPEQILEKIAEGKLNKFFQENCLLEQAFVKDNSKTISQLVEDLNKKYEAKAKIALFHRFHLSDENK